MAAKGIKIALIITCVFLATGVAVCILEKLGVIPTPPFLIGAEAILPIGPLAMPPPSENLGTIKTKGTSFIDQGIDFVSRRNEQDLARQLLAYEKAIGLTDRQIEEFLTIYPEYGSLATDREAFLSILRKVNARQEDLQTLSDDDL